MKASSFMKALVLGAGATIFLVGLAIAQPAPAPAPQGGDNPRRAIAEACRTEIGTSVRGPERREAMRKCTEEKREKAGLNQRNDRKAGREAKKEERQKARKACQDQTKDQRMTVAERRSAVQDCLAKSDPKAAKTNECRKEAQAKNLSRGSKEFRQHMRACAGPRRG